MKYLDALRDAYEAANFLGVSIGFVTERQLAESGVPAGTRLLIVPNAQYVEDNTVAALHAIRGKGVVVGIIGQESLTRQPTGATRKDAAVGGARLISVGTPQEYHRQFDDWLKEAGVHRELLAMDGEGRCAWGIELRTARLGEQRLAYLANLMRDPVKVKLRWRAVDAHLRDWRADTSIDGEVILEPRQVIFGGN